MTKAMMLDMDDARKARFKKVCNLMADEIAARLKGVLGE